VPKADLVVGPEAGSGARLDVFLADRIEGLSRAQVRKVIDAGGVRVGSYARKAGYKLKPGDRVHAEYEIPEPEGALVPQNIPLKIITMDADVIVIDKPPNLVVHPGPGHPSNAVNALLYHFLRSSSPASRAGHRPPARPGHLGVMVVARSPGPVPPRPVQASRRLETYLAWLGDG
jgi:23S rRNA pseudouridine1911/1915/1917 synthase